MVKPIRDALNGVIYEDDRQIRHSELFQVGIDEPIRVRRGSLILLTAFNRGNEFVYVRIADAPNVIQLPEEP